MNVVVFVFNLLCVFSECVNVVIFNGVREYDRVKGYCVFNIGFIGFVF